MGIFGYFAFCYIMIDSFSSFSSVDGALFNWKGDAFMLISACTCTGKFLILCQRRIIQRLAVCSLILQPVSNAKFQMKWRS